MYGMLSFVDNIIHVTRVYPPQSRFKANHLSVQLRLFVDSHNNLVVKELYEGWLDWSSVDMLSSGSNGKSSLDFPVVDSICKILGMIIESKWMIYKSICIFIYVKAMTKQLPFIPFSIETFKKWLMYLPEK